ncbi:hypothetical protein MAM1_0183d07438 [Mucor ambiguus]|uniref:Uncharacterized protein n=1 Tax=Mucor ambiguus TaxID=91626 RepID=A0A0C9N032_9FUNG|nr:hypothetical protein MAM1_0183d07438 [Mucor ambiguus]
MSSSKSLPSSFKQNKRPIFHNNSTISRVTIEGGSHSSSNSSDQIQSAYKDIYSSSFSSSNVKISSPLTKPAWLQHEGDVTVNTNSSGTTSDKSWMTRRWSTVSGSLIARRKNKKTTASRLWTNRQKRRTFPPSTDILKRERKKFALPPAVPPINKKHHRQSLQDILTTFYKYNDPYNVASSSSGGGLGGGMDSNESGSTPTTTSSSSMSKRLGRILKKRGKQPYNNRHKKPILTINTHTKYTEDELKAVMMSMFQPPATISSKSSTPSSPLRFPTPPKRFSAYYVNSQGKSGKVNYKHKMALSHYILQFIQHGVFSSHTPPSGHIPPLSSPEKGHYKAYNRQLVLSMSLFLFGFIFFPCWWVGAWLYYRKRQRQRQSGSLAGDDIAEDVFYEHDLFSIRTIAYLNTVFSCLSFVLVAVVVSLVIWLVKS